MEQCARRNQNGVPANSVAEATWYLAYTKPRQERLAQLNLDQQAFETYLPLFKTLSKNVAPTHVQTLEVFEPMFARYIFFRPSSARQSIATARSTRGLSSIVSFGSKWPPSTRRLSTRFALRARTQYQRYQRNQPFSNWRQSAHAGRRNAIASWFGAFSFS